MCVNIFIQWLIRNSQVKCMRCRVSGEFIKVRCRVHVYGLKKCMFEPSLFGNKNLDWNSLEIIYFHLFFFSHKYYISAKITFSTFDVPPYNKMDY